MPLTRRQMMKLSAGALLAAQIWPGRVRGAGEGGGDASGAAKPLKFAAINDLHYTDDACAPFFEGLVKHLNEIEGLGCVLLVGDLTDAGHAGQAHALHDIFARLRAPCHYVIGNHDYLGQTDRSPFDGVFGNTLNYTFEQDGWQFVGLDTTDGVIWQEVSCGKATLDYAAGLWAKLDRRKPVILFTHFPLGPGVNNRLKNADALLEPFKGLNLAAVFNGHHHGMTQKTVLDHVTATTFCCCSRKAINHDGTVPKGFCLAEAADGVVRRKFVEYGTEFPGSAKPEPAK